MELITLAVMLCHNGICLERVITNSEQSAITFSTCKAHGQFGIAQWFASNPQFADYQIKSWRCVLGEYIPQREA